DGDFVIAVLTEDYDLVHVSHLEEIVMAVDVHVELASLRPRAGDIDRHCVATVRTRHSEQAADQISREHGTSFQPFKHHWATTNGHGIPLIGGGRQMGK